MSSHRCIPRSIIVPPPQALRRGGWEMASGESCNFSAIRYSLLNPSHPREARLQALAASTSINPRLGKTAGSSSLAGASSVRAPGPVPPPAPRPTPRAAGHAQHGAAGLAGRRVLLQFATSAFTQSDRGKCTHRTHTENRVPLETRIKTALGTYLYCAILGAPTLFKQFSSATDDIISTLTLSLNGKHSSFSLF